MQKDIFRKLNILHLAGVYHLDIKGLNIAVQNRKLFFVDWGLSEVSYPDESSLESTVEYNFLDKRSDYHNYVFFRLIRHFLDKKHRDELYKIVYNYYVKDQYANCLRVIDIFTLYCAVIADPYVVQNKIRPSEFYKTSQFFYNEIVHTIDFFIEQRQGPILHSEPRTPAESKERSNSRKRKSEDRTSSARRSKMQPPPAQKSTDTLDFYTYSPDSAFRPTSKIRSVLPPASKSRSTPKR
jgi:hypothetical protein